MIKRLKFFYLKSYSIATFISIVIIVFLPPMFNKYEIKIVEKGLIQPTLDAKVYHADIDMDGNSEQVVSYTNEVGNHAIQIFTPGGGIIDQWNFLGPIANAFLSKRLITGDYDKDGFLEVYTHYQVGDTIFLSCFEPMDTITPYGYRSVKLCELIHTYAEPDCSINKMLLRDVDGDKSEDFIIYVNSGRARFPRGIYVYDLKNDSVYRSPVYGIDPSPLKVVDLDNDGKVEFYGGTVAAGNVHDSLGVPYHDYSAWIMAFDHQFNLLFKPVEFSGFRSCIEAVNVYDSLMMIYYYHTGSGVNHPEMMLMNKEGKVLKKRQLPQSSKFNQILFFNRYKNTLTYWIFDSSGKGYAYDEQFDHVKTIDLGIGISGCEDIELDEGSEQVQLIGTYSEKIFIAKNNFKYMASYQFEKKVKISGYSIIKRNNNSNLLSLQNGDEYFNLQFQKNPLAPLRYLIYLGIFLVFWLFILLIQKLQLIQIQKQKRVRNEIFNLQLKNIKGQLDPHFTFNVFNTMASIVKKESEAAYTPFIKFTQLIRSTLTSSDKITRSIEEEIQYIESYLSLENLRFKNKFEYNIVIDKDVDLQTNIPKMFLQTYVENAIKHGIRYKETKGKILISISKTKDYHEFVVADDGIGRTKAKELSADSTGFGLKIMENYFKLFNEYNRSKIKHEIIDLFDDNNHAVGTKIRILLPLSFNYRIQKNES